MVLPVQCLYRYTSTHLFKGTLSGNITPHFGCNLHRISDSTDRSQIGKAGTVPVTKPMKSATYLVKFTQ